MEEAIFSPASQRISELKKLRDEKASGIYGRFDEAVKVIDPRKE